MQSKEAKIPCRLTHFVNVTTYSRKERVFHFLTKYTMFYIIEKLFKNAAQLWLSFQFDIFITKKLCHFEILRN